MANMDRIVHASGLGWELVRYDRAGKWKQVDTSTGVERPVTLTEVVQLATSEGATWFERRPGGRAFDAQMRKAGRR